MMCKMLLKQLAPKISCVTVFWSALSFFFKCQHHPVMLQEQEVSSSIFCPCSLPVSSSLTPFLVGVYVYVLTLKDDSVAIFAGQARRVGIVLDLILCLCGNDYTGLSPLLNCCV